MLATPWLHLALIGPALGLLALAGVYGGAWAGLALFYMTLGVAGLDYLADRAPPCVAPSVMPSMILPVFLGGCHFLVLFGTLAALCLGPLGLGAKLLLFGAAGLFLGQVSNSNAHELIHARHPAHRALGEGMYTSLLFGHHTSAHCGVHHVHVATPKDPCTARFGEGFWRFLSRCWLGSLRAAWALERRRAARRSHRIGHLQNPFWRYGLGGGAAVILVWVIFGAAGILAYLALCALAQIQLILCDYVQHYGLRRAQISAGRYAPLGAEHAWDAPHWASSLLMLHAPRHADHHLHPGRSYAQLDLPQKAPRLPYPLPVMATLALCPPLWRRVVHRCFPDQIEGSPAAIRSGQTALKHPLYGDETRARPPTAPPPPECSGPREATHGH